MSSIARALGLILLSCLGPVFSRPLQAGSNDYVVIVLDDSGSMREIMKRDRRSRIEAAKIALSQVVKQIAPDTNLGILLLNGARANNHWYVPVGPVDTQQINQRIQSLQANGGTPLGEALRIASDELLTLRSKKIYGTYRLIVVTDGEASDQALLDQYLPDILSRGILIDAIGVDMRSDHSLATKVHSYRRADDQDSLANAIQEIMAERTSDDQSGGEEDFSMLEGLGDLDVAEVLKALAKPNNEKITGIAFMHPTTQPNPNAGNLPSNIPAPWTPSAPAGNVSVQPPVERPSLLTQVIGTVCSCCIPLLVVLFFVSAFLTSSKTKRR